MAGASLQHFGRGALRVAKNYTKGYTDTQTKVRDATSNDPWGPSGTQMNEVAQMTYNQSDFVEIMEMMDKRLNDKGKNWRHVFKALTLLDYCLHAGSENVVVYFKDNIYIVKTLKEFVYVDDDGKDVGANVRQKAKDITNLLQDEDRLRAERRARGAMRDRMLGNIADSGLRGEGDHGDGAGGGGRSSYEAPRSPPPRRQQRKNSDDDLQKAIEESRRMTEDEAIRRSQVDKEEDDLKRAMRESEEEEARRKREQDKANETALFDDSLNLQSNNQYQQQPQVDLFSQQTGMYQQQLQPQYTSYNPFHAQTMQQQQQEEFMRQQMMQQEQQRQQEEWMRQQQQQQWQQQQAMQAQPTGYGSNNPFAPVGSQSLLGNQQQQPSPQPPTSFLPVPNMSSINEERPAPVQPAQAPKPAFNLPPRKADTQHGELAGFLARGREDGMDTFGNMGNLRFGANNPFGRPQQGQQQQQQQQQGQQGKSDQPFFSI